jgi:hypothetical protein
MAPTRSSRPDATLASYLREGEFDNLPDTQDAQRLAIIIWRTKLEAIAARSGVPPSGRSAAGRARRDRARPEG